MDIETIRNYCLSLTAVEECFPFDDVTAVYKVGGKMFILVSWDFPLSINVKCDPEKAIELREHFSAVTPGYHMNKTHWNSVALDGSISQKTVLGWIFDSYWLVRNSLTRIKKLEINKLESM